MKYNLKHILVNLFTKIKKTSNDKNKNKIIPVQDIENLTDKLLYYLNNKKQENNNLNLNLKENKNLKFKNIILNTLKNIKINNTTSNKNFVDLNKNIIIINQKKQAIKKINYFDSNSDKKKNKELIIFRTNLNKLKKSTFSLFKKKNKLTSKINSKYKILNILSMIFKNYITNVASFLKLSGFKSKYFRINKNQNLLGLMQIEKHNKSDLLITTQDKNLKQFKNLNNKNNKQEEKNNDYILTKLIYKKKAHLLTPEETIKFKSLQNNFNILTSPSPLKFINKKFNLNIELENKKSLTFLNKIQKKEMYLVKKENLIGREGFGFIDKNKDPLRYKRLLAFYNLEKEIINSKATNFESENKISLLKVNKENKLIFNKKKKIKNYIKSITNFNSKVAKFVSKSNNYNFYRYNQINNQLKNNIYEFLYNSFISMFILISKPIFIIKPDKIVIQFFYLLLKQNIVKKKNESVKSLLFNFKNKFNLQKKIPQLKGIWKSFFKNDNINKFKNDIKDNRKSIFIFKNNKKLNIISNILTRFFNKPIEFELVRLFLPHYNSNILVNFIGMFINKIKLRKIINKLKLKSITKIFKKNKNIASLISGFKFKVGGRLLTQKSVPRKTVKFITSGSLARDKTILVETARFSNKNKKGAFSLTVSIGHRLINSKG